MRGKRDLLVSAGGEITVDPFAINGGPMGLIGSLKECACKLNAPSLRSLPYAPGRSLSHDEMLAVVEYNAVDLEVTALVADVQAEKIAGRIALAREYGLLSIIDIHDAKVAEVILAKQLFGSRYPTYPTVQSWTLTADVVTNKFAYRTPALQDLLARIPNMEFQVETEETKDGPIKRIDVRKFSDSVKVGGVTYTIGVGGLHSDDEPMLFVADDVFTFLDLDVDSYYPSLMLNHKLVAGHLPDSLLEEYDNLRQKRLLAKRDGKTDLANGLKVAINSVFGKSSSAYSWLCDPRVMVQTTLLGQLTLLWLVDALAIIDGVEVISANTDGLTLKVRRDVADFVKREMDQAAAQVDLTLSWCEYRLIARRDVCNYIAVSTDGTKCKGSYAYDRTDLKKKATNRVVVDAVREYFVNNTPVADTVRNCGDIREFINYFKTSKGYSIVDDTGRDHGTIARWYVGTTGVRLLKKKDDKLTQLVAGGAARGNRHDTMVALMTRLWIAGAGTLSRADLLWAADQLDEEAALPASDKRGIVDWVVSRVSPFPLPRTIQEHVARAMAWASETIKPVKRKRKLEHSGVLRSDYIKGDALRVYEKGKSVYKLACSLSAINVRNGAGLSEEQVCGIIDQIDEFLA